MKPLKYFLIATGLLLVMNSSIVRGETTLTDLQGNPASFKSDQGKVIWLDFWASWCVPCRASFPWLNKVQQQYQSQGFEVIAINLDKDRSEVDRFLKRYPAQFKILLDPKGNSAKQFKVKGMPSSYLINREGKIIGQHLGFSSKHVTEYEQQIKHALEQ